MKNYGYMWQSWVFQKMGPWKCKENFLTMSNFLTKCQRAQWAVLDVTVNKADEYSGIGIYWTTSKGLIITYGDFM